MKKDMNTTMNRTEKRAGRRTWKLVVTGLSAAAVVATMYALMLPAQTLQPKLACGLEQHVHDASCYTEVKKPICGLTEAEAVPGHKHTDECYKAELICGLTAGEGHTHTEACRNEKGELICGLEESKAHTHTDDCYKKTLVCGLQETPAAEGHKHTEECYEVSRILSCKLTEHAHTAVCYIHGDAKADVETPDRWESEIAALSLTGNQAAARARAPATMWKMKPGTVPAGTVMPRSSATPTAISALPS